MANRGPSCKLDDQATGDRKNPEPGISIGRSCFIGIRTETRNWPGSIELLFLFPSLFLFFFFFRSTEPDCGGGQSSATRTFTIIICFRSVLENKTPCARYSLSHANQMSEKFWALCFFSFFSFSFSSV